MRTHSPRDFTTKRIEDTSPKSDGMTRKAKKLSHKYSNKKHGGKR